MRTLTLIEHVSLDGAMQVTDDGDGLPYHDWTASYRTPEGRDFVALGPLDADVTRARRRPRRRTRADRLPGAARHGRAPLRARHTRTRARVGEHASGGDGGEAGEVSGERGVEEGAAEGGHCAERDSTRFDLAL